MSQDGEGEENLFLKLRDERSTEEKKTSPARMREGKMERRRWIEVQ